MNLVYFVQVNLLVNVLSVSFPCNDKAFNAPADLLKTVVRTMNTAPMSMDFHAVQQTRLLDMLLF